MEFCFRKLHSYNVSLFFSRRRTFDISDNDGDNNNIENNQESDNNEEDDRSVNVEYAAGDNSDESDGDLLESPFQKKKKQRKVTEEMWAGVEAEVVEHLPDGIDGLRVFKIPLKHDEKEGRDVLRDGRRWKKNCPTQWKGHNRVRYADCNGSHKCCSARCPFRLEFGVVNTTQFRTKKDGSVVCSACNERPLFVKCPARRYISCGSRFTKVFHYGQHTCPVIKPLKKNKTQVRQLIRDNPKIKPSEIQSACVLSAFREQADWSTVEKEVESTLDRQWLSNVKKEMKRKTEPIGHDFEAVVTFKQYCDKKDSFYIYKINDRRGNPDRPSFVFKMGMQKANMAINMDRNGDHFLKDEFCYFDGKRKRCRGFVTLTASIYHSLLRKQIPLAVMEAESEDTTNIELFWTLFNEVLQKVSGQKDYKFNPVGWCTDMAGANFAAISKVFGNESAHRMKSCEFHFKDQRNKKAQRLQTDSSDRFKELCDELLKSATEVGYNKAKAGLDNFIEECEDHAFLKTWVSWWHERRGFIFRAFAPSNAPEMNQAEVIHAGWAHRDSPNLSLLDVCHADVRDSVIVDTELQTYQAGIRTSGTGPSLAECKRRQRVKELEKAKRIGKELFENSNDGRFIDPSSQCAPPKNNKRKARKPANGRAKAQKSVDPGQTASSATPQSTVGSFLASSNGRPSMSPVASTVTSNNSSNLSYISSQWSSLPAFTAFSAETTFPAHASSPQQSVPPPYQWHSGLSPYTYEIVRLPSNVQKCYGCSTAFCEKYRSAPNNLVIKHIDRRVIGKNSAGNLIYGSDFTNTYYHPNISHIKRKNPVFTGLVYISTHLYNSLDARCRQVLDSFQLNVLLK